MQGHHNSAPERVSRGGPVPSATQPWPIVYTVKIE